MTNEKKPEETTTKQKMITISPLCSVSKEAYRMVAELTLSTMDKCIERYNDELMNVVMDLRDAVFKRAGERLNGLGK